MRKDDNLTTILCGCQKHLGNLTSWNPLGHSRPVTGLLYLFIIINTYRSSCKVLTSLLKLQFRFEFFDRFSENFQITNFMKIRPEAADFFKSKKERMDGYTKMTKLMLSFRSLVNASKDRYNE